MKILVTGGAGYIGSHVVRQLDEQGHDVVVYDNCSVGKLENVLAGTVVVADLSSYETLYRTFEQHAFDAVMHFAASTVVSDSVVRPLDYYQNNLSNTLNVLRCAQVFQVNQLVFSSTAAVYGHTPNEPVDESFPTQPINPYGRSKLMGEEIIRDYAQASDLRYVILRYFNVAGADPLLRIGQSTAKATNLMKVVCEAAVGLRAEVKVFGTDFPTPDGTGVRDYIHVEDLGAAHLKALTYLGAGGESLTLNCGYGQGYSVHEVIETIKRLSGAQFPVTIAARRPGDPAFSLASSARIRQLLGWQPQFDSLEKMAISALAWEQKLAGLALCDSTWKASRSHWRIEGV